MSKRFKLERLVGEVFEHLGKVAGAIPPLNREDAIPFRVGTVCPATAEFPAWADMIVRTRIRTRINPDICQPPFFRLFDVVATIARNEQRLLAIDDDSPEKVTAKFQGQVFYFWPAWIGDVRAIMVDTEERILKWNPNFEHN
ncbi:hypothetical protein ETAA8_45600 [Anatilimnocola aggregata]|uniref:Uncharacterized protein n=1 Tax=Anatilimnocola aggregata TaxID=2528021 RepID=A0A517YGU0_9BACT|nr:hypothetical protein [Anatilimnocola aggregata]QDU29450.1 hypothetical protein ETAA8_45600 [Anatilimnocola aggregata]